MILLSGCSYLTGPQEVYYFAPEAEKEGRYLEEVPLSDKWNKVKVLDYSYGHFTFPPPNGYRVLHYVDYLDNVSLDLFREVITEEDGFLDIIKRRRGADHCELYGENITTLGEGDFDLIEVFGNCHVWHRGEFKRKYYFLRVGNLVYTFRLFSGVKEFERNLQEFDNFVDYTIQNYLLYPTEEEATPYQIAYPISREELISFFKPAAEYLAQKQ